MTEQWATTAEPPYGFGDVQVGDVITISLHGDSATGKVCSAGDGQLVQIKTFGRVIDAYRSHQVELVSRPRPALPDRPGTVGTATVRGRRMRVMLCQDAEGAKWWACSSPIAADAIAPILVHGNSVEDFERLDVCRDGLLA